MEAQRPVGKGLCHYASTMIDSRLVGLKSNVVNVVEVELMVEWWWGI